MSATILIVEDHNTLRKALREWLGRVFPQYRILEAASGEEAVALVKACAPHLVLMDITLPHMTGLEATRQIRANAPAAQVVILTLNEDEVYRTAAAAAGASGYVPKRRMETELLSTLTPLLINQEESG